MDLFRRVTPYDIYLRILNDPALRTTADKFESKYLSKESLQEIIDRVQKEQLEELRQAALMNLPCPWFENSRTRKKSEYVISSTSRQDNKKFIEPITSGAAKQYEEYEYRRTEFKMTDDEVESLIQQTVHEVLSRKSVRSRIKSFSHRRVDEELDEKQPRKNAEEHNKLENNISTCSMPSLINVGNVISSGQDNKKIIQPITSEAAKQDEQYEYRRIEDTKTHDEVHRLIQQAVHEVLSIESIRSRISTFSYSMVDEELDEKQPRKNVEEHDILEYNISTWSMPSLINVGNVISSGQDNKKINQAVTSEAAKQDEQYEYRRIEDTKTHDEVDRLIQQAVHEVLSIESIRSRISTFSYSIVDEEFDTNQPWKNVEVKEHDTLKDNISTCSMPSLINIENVISSGQDNKKIIQPITSEAAKQDEQYEYRRLEGTKTHDEVDRLIQQALHKVLSRQSVRKRIRTFQYSIVDEEPDENQSWKNVDEHDTLKDNISICSMPSLINVGPRAESLPWNNSENIGNFENVGNRTAAMVALNEINKNEDYKHLSPKFNNQTDFTSASTRNSSSSELSEMDFDEPIFLDDSFSDSLSLNFDILPKDNRRFNNDSERNVFIPYNKNADSKQSKPSFTSIEREELRKMLGITANIVDMEKEQWSESYKNIDNAWEIKDDPQFDVVQDIPFPQLSISAESLELVLGNLKSNDTWSMVNIDSMIVPRRKVTISTQTETRLPSNHSSIKYYGISRISRSVPDSPEDLIGPEKPKPETNQKNKGIERAKLLHADEREHCVTKLTDHQNSILKMMKEIREFMMNSPNTISKADKIKMEYHNNKFANRLEKTHIHQLRKMISDIRYTPAHQFHSATSNASLIKLCTVYNYLLLNIDIYANLIKQHFSQVYPKKLVVLFKIAMEITSAGIAKNIFSKDNKFIKTFLDKCQDMIYFLATQKDIKRISEEKIPLLFSPIENTRLKNRLYMYQTPKKLVRKKIPKTKVEQPQIQKRNAQTLKNSLKTDLKRNEKQTTIKKVVKNLDQKKEEKCELKVSKNVNKKDVNIVDKKIQKKTKSTTDKTDEPKKIKNKKICFKTRDKLSDTQEDIGPYVLPKSDNVNSRDPEENKLVVLYERKRQPKKETAIDLSTKNMIHEIIKPFLPNLGNLFNGTATRTDLEIIVNALNVASKQLPEDPSTGNAKTFEQKDNVLETGDDYKHNAKQEEQQIGVHAVSTEPQLGLSQSKQRDEALLNRRRCLPLREDNDVFDASSSAAMLQRGPDFGESTNDAKDHSKGDEDGARALPPSANPNTQQQPVQHKPKVNNKRNLTTGKNTTKQIKMDKNLRPHKISSKKVDETVPTQAPSTRDMEILKLVEARNRRLIQLEKNKLYSNRVFNQPWKVIPRLANSLLDGLIISTMKDMNSECDNLVRDFLKSELKSSKPI